MSKEYSIHVTWVGRGRFSGSVHGEGVNIAMIDITTLTRTT